MQFPMYRTFSVNNFNWPAAMLLLKSKVFNCLWLAINLYSAWFNSKKSAEINLLSSRLHRGRRGVWRFETSMTLSGTQLEDSNTYISLHFIQTLHNVIYIIVMRLPSPAMVRPEKRHKLKLLGLNTYLSKIICPNTENTTRTNHIGEGCSNSWWWLCLPRSFPRTQRGILSPVVCSCPRSWPSRNVSWSDCSNWSYSPGEEWIREGKLQHNASAWRYYLAILCNL